MLRALHYNSATTQSPLLEREGFLLRYSDVETFLAVVTQKSVSKAANSLFVAQSTVSQRIQKLEYELGGPLLIRKQGINGVALTPKGEQFLSVAEKLLNLWRETDIMVKEEPTIPLAIGCIESLAIGTFPPLFEDIINADKNIQLSIICRNSDILYNMVDQRQLDVAFSVRSLNLPRICCRPVFREQMYLVCQTGMITASGPVDVSTLDIRNEVFFSWSPEFRAWHNSLWGAGIRPSITVDTTSLLLRFMTDQRYWTVCPVSIADYLRKAYRIELHEIQSPPPERITYLITHNEPMEERKKSLAIFNQCFCKFQEECGAPILERPL